MPVQTRIQIRRGTSVQWTASVDALSAGEIGYDTTLKKIKLGDGSTLFNSLPWLSVLPSGAGGLSGTSGIYLIGDSSGGVLISLTGLKIGSDIQAYDAGLNSIANLNTVSGNYIYTTGTDAYTTGTITAFARNLLASADAASSRTALGLGTISSEPSGNYALTSHTHLWSNISDASSRATLTELSYLSGVNPGVGSGTRAVVLDSNKDFSGIRNLTMTGDLTVQNLNVNGTTTTVNSTTVNIGDNIIRVNTSGLTTGGIEVYTPSSTVQSLLWNNPNNRWEFTGGNVYTSGYFLSSISGGTAVSLSYISGVSAASPTYLYNCAIDGGSP